MSAVHWSLSHTLSVKVNDTISERQKSHPLLIYLFIYTLDNTGPIPEDPGFLDFVSENVINHDL